MHQLDFVLYVPYILTARVFQNIILGPVNA